MILPWVIIRRKNIFAIHKRNRDLDETNRRLFDENQSLKLTVKVKDDENALLKDKCSRVNLSKLHNEIDRLRGMLKDHVAHDDLFQTRREGDK